MSIRLCEVIINSISLILYSIFTFNSPSEDNYNGLFSLLIDTQLVMFQSNGSQPFPMCGPLGIFYWYAGHKIMIFMGIRGPLQLISRTTTSDPQSRLWEPLFQSISYFNFQGQMIFLKCVASLVSKSCSNTIAFLSNQFFLVKVISFDPLHMVTNKPLLCTDKEARSSAFGRGKCTNYETPPSCTNYETLVYFE